MTNVLCWTSSGDLFKMCHMYVLRAYLIILLGTGKPRFINL